MRPGRLVVRLASVATLAATVSACADERVRAPGAEPPAAACVPRGESHARICGLAPRHRRAGEDATYELATVAGRQFSAVLPDELASPSGVVAVPKVPLRVNAELTTATPREAADRYCQDFPACEVAAVDRGSVPSGLMTRWDDASGSVRDLGVTTVDIGRWTFVMMEPDAKRAERVARALRWTVDDYPQVVSTDRGVPVDADWAGVALWVPGPEDRYAVIEIVPGCELSAKRPDLGGSDARPELELHESGTVTGGRWCVDGRYAVDVSLATRPLLALLHDKLRIVR